MAFDEPREITVLYGSQTGTAQEVAERIAREARRRHFNTNLTALDDFQMVKDSFFFLLLLSLFFLSPLPIC